MDDVKKKVLLDLFASPWSVLPMVAGLTTLLASWAADGGSLLTFAGIAGILVGAGVMATRWIFGLEDIAADAYRYFDQLKREEQEQALDALHKRLSRQRDDRGAHALRDLRSLYATFEAKAAAGAAGAVKAELRSNVDRLVSACVRQLEHSLELAKNERGTSGKARRAIQRQLERVLGEVAGAIEHLGTALDQLDAIKEDTRESDLARLRGELDETMRVARLAEERMATLRAKSYDEAEFE